MNNFKFNREGTESYPKSLAEVEKEQIEYALRHYKGNRSYSATALGISRSTLIRLIKQYNITK